MCEHSRSHTPHPQLVQGSQTTVHSVPQPPISPANFPSPEFKEQRAWLADEPLDLSWWPKAWTAPGIPRRSLKRGDVPSPENSLQYSRWDAGAGVTAGSGLETCRTQSSCQKKNYWRLKSVTTMLSGFGTSLFSLTFHFTRDRRQALNQNMTTLWYLESENLTKHPTQSSESQSNTCWILWPETRMSFRKTAKTCLCYPQRHNEHHLGA